MSGQIPTSDNFWLLLDAACDGTLVETQMQELATLLDSDLQLRKVFTHHVQLRTDIRLLFRAERARDLGIARIRAARQAASLPSPVLAYLGNTIHGTIGFFSQEIPFAVLIATLITGLVLWIGSLFHMSRLEQIEQIANNSLPIRTVAEPKMEIVGQITGMADCKWADPATMPIGDNVVLDRKFALASGLMEITYNTAQKVILQGPVTYEVESKNGGFLPVGKLTGRVENEAAKGFAIRTPTAVVTDLGTEFGVEVSKAGSTTSHVFFGSVQLQVASVNGQAEPLVRVLHANESARVENQTGGQDVGHRVTVFKTPVKLANFVHEIPCENPKPTIKPLDLVDVVAGGNGFSGRRGRGIDPTTGRIRDIQPDNRDMQGDYKYHRVEGIPFVDGVFIPEGSKGPVQVDSAGHVFPDCPKTDNNSWAYVWACGKLPQAIAVKMSATLEGIDYSSSEHAVLVMHANKGITFDLDAIRRGNPGCKVLRFRAVAGNTETESEKGENVSADFWVLVDGQVRFKRREFSGYNGAAPVTIPIYANDRFLTLAATDGGNSYRCDQIIFGDPHLEMESQSKH